jgi:hypothetical protein
VKSSNFDNLCKQILESITTSSAGVGSTQPSVEASGDFYAPGDARIPKVLGAKKKKGEKVPVIRRPFPTGL